MQLAKNLFLSPDRSFHRKIQEALLAIQIERRFTKPQIFTLYANQIYLGHGVMVLKRLRNTTSANRQRNLH